MICQSKSTTKFCRIESSAFHGTTIKSFYPWNDSVITSMDTAACQRHKNKCKFNVSNDWLFMIFNSLALFITDKLKLLLNNSLKPVCNSVMQICPSFLSWRQTFLFESWVAWELLSIKVILLTLPYASDGNSTFGMQSIKHPQKHLKTHTKD